ncbi:hypothetical protein [Alkalihalobacillus sp. CinArs1]|uniref:hypothetical protein n=1 Tax=Alkalihalobacillus sp. CinArs1 TaxID=2995314 RepID=UPI0022DD8080|nr:hypothetical protein [Alkalihalobacillus sp. CinArs1]
MSEVATAKTVSEVRPTFAKSLKASLVGGIVAGIIFGLLMQMMGRMGMVAGLMGSESIAVGWIVHMAISIVFALGFGAAAVFTSKTYLLGVVHGIAIWIIGPLLVMPAMMGMGTMIGQAFTSGQMMNLGTHLMFSLILAFVYKKAR